MNFDKCLRLSDAAKKDPTLIKNHTEGPKGVDYYLKHHIAETVELLDACKNDQEFIARLEIDLRKLNLALAVYT